MRPTPTPKAATCRVMVWYGMVLQPYSHPPHIKHANTFYMYEVDLL